MKKRSPWPIAIIAFLSAVFVVNFSFLYLALKSDDGLADKDYYIKGLFYNNMVQDEKELGWRIRFNIERKDEGALISATVLDAEKRPVDGVKLVTTLKRPATDRFDKEITLRRDGAAYVGYLKAPLPGYWDIEVKAKKDGRSVEKTFRVRV